jgi:hypothetical protein
MAVEVYLRAPTAAGPKNFSHSPISHEANIAITYHFCEEKLE